MSETHILLTNVFFAPFTYGGATVVAEEVAKALLRRGGYRITVVSLCARTELGGHTVIRSERDGITNYIINVRGGRSYTQLYDSSEVTEIVAQLMDQLSPDLVHAHCVQDIGAGILEAAEERGIPSVLSVHDFWWLCERQFMIRPEQKYCGQNPVRIEACRGCVNDYDAAKLRFTRLQALGSLPARVTYPSQFAHELSAASGFAPDTGIVWENGVRLPGPEFSEAQAARRTQDPMLTFGFVGGPSQIKGWPIIKAAFAALDRSDFRVVVVDGSIDGSWWQGRNLNALPGEWIVQPRFSQEEIDVFYEKIDVLLFLSQWKETFGLTIREALARGIGVIQTDSGGTTEHVAAKANDLIPIGAPASVLTERLAAELAAHPSYGPAHPVASYDAQAEAFDAIVSSVLGEAG